MKMAVLHVNSAAAAATSPTMRIARFAAQHLGVPLIHDVATAEKYRNAKFDVLFVKYGVLKFSNHREDALRIYGNAGRVINLENDYAFKPDSRFRKLHEDRYQVWGTVPANVKAFGGAYVNWNCLTWLYPRPWAAGVAVPASRSKGSAAPGLLYYGAFRPDRVDSFNHYFGPHAAHRKVIGARSTHIKKFQALSEDIEILNFRKPQELVEVGLPALYMEDDTSHDLYCSLANRFFEMLQLGIPQLLDASGYKTYKEARLPDFMNFMVQNTEEVEDMLRDYTYEELREAQLALWYRDFDEKLHAQLDRARRTL